VPSYINATVSCSIVHPSIDPKTGNLVVIHSVCTGSKDGIYMYAPDGSGTPEPLVQSDYAGIQPSLQTPSWAADGSGFVFIGLTTAKVNGADAVVRGLFAYDMATKKPTPVLLPDQPDMSIDSAAAAPDARAIVYCLRHGSAYDLHIIDLTKTPATDAALTNDGKSCHPVW
jgi:hypothetical protein